MGLTPKKHRPKRKHKRYCPCPKCVARRLDNNALKQVINGIDSPFLIRYEWEQTDEPYKS